MNKIMNLDLAGIDLTQFESVFAIHPQLGWALKVIKPCNCGSRHCRNPNGDIVWFMEHGLHNGLALRGIHIIGDTHAERFEYLKEFAATLFKIDAYVASGVTLHLMPAGYAHPTEYRNALPQCYPVPDSRWHELIVFYSQWCEVEKAMRERKEHARVGLN